MKSKGNLRLILAAALLIVLVPLTLVSCTGEQGVQGPAGAAGAPGAPGTSSGTLAGTVTDSLTKAAVAGVVITTDPAVAGVTIQSDTSGKYTAALPIGSYTLTFTKAGFTSGTDKATLVAGQAATKNVALGPVSAIAAAQWKESLHGSYAAAIPRITSASCARCHTGQGFMAWLKQGDLTKSLLGADGKTTATAAELTALGLTADTVQPVTCTVCHDGDPTVAKLRIEGDTAMLPAGFKATAVGDGALCITCHNTRNLAHNNFNAPTAYSAPHQAAQGDVLMGENAYFVSESQRSAHSYIKDTCAYCHMVASPPPAESSYLGGTNHGFEASTAICSQCHSATLDATALQAGIEAKLLKLGEKMGAYLLSKMSAQVHIKDYTPHTYQSKSYDVKSNDMTVDKANIVAVESVEPHGQQGFILKFKTPVTFTYAPTGEAVHTVSLAEAEVQLGDFTTDGTAKLVAFTDPLVKAGWNYFLIHGDASEGIHNPAFVNAVLDASIAALK
ncbi:MAG: carboxypeptidase-like regulatory domain-containing protein [Chloroflexota bacterium]